jgi:hypothetical protein
MLCAVTLSVPITISSTVVSGPCDFADDESNLLIVCQGGSCVTRAGVCVRWIVSAASA